MILEQWLYLYLLATIVFAGYKILPLAIQHRSLTFGLFSVSIISVLTGTIFSFTATSNSPGAEWARLVAVIFCICALFAFIRASKPVFARFPTYMVFLPLISIVFYPLTVDALVLKQLILATYEGGALLVAIIFLTTRTLKSNSPEYYSISGVVLVTAAYSIFWFVPDSLINTLVVSLALLGAGIILTALGFSRDSEILKLQ